MIQNLFQQYQHRQHQKSKKDKSGKSKPVRRLFSKENRNKERNSKHGQKIRENEYIFDKKENLFRSKSARRRRPKMNIFSSLERSNAIKQKKRHLSGLKLQMNNHGNPKKIERSNQLNYNDFKTNQRMRLKIRMNKGNPL